MIDMTGKIITVRGAIEPEDLGFTLMHEHLYLDLRKNHLPDSDASDAERAVWQEPLGLSNLYLARMAAPLLDNYLLSNESDAIEEVSHFAGLGGGALVDVTSRGLGRNPAALARASGVTGVSIVMGSGWYQKVFHPEDMDARSVEALTTEIVSDISEGVGGTDIRAGIIGEIGVNGDPVTENEVKSIRAAARASLLTGAAISFHSPQKKTEKHTVIDIVEGEGADPSRIILGHSCGMADDVPFILELLARGVCIEFDTLGVVRTSERPARDNQVARAILQLIDAGYTDRILLSQDVCWKMHLRKYGGAGYTYIQETFLPYLQTLGMDTDTQRQIMFESPKRLLTIGIGNRE